MRSIFIVAPHFPPSAMPPSQRVRLLVRHLHEFGWWPVVFTVDHYYREELADPWMLEITGDRYEKVQVNCFDQRKTRKIGIGDIGLRMFIFLFSSLRKHARKKKPALMLYPVPPWYIMVMAPLIKRLTGVPFVIDFIDPWIYKVSGRNRKARMSQWIARRLERYVIKSADGIIAVSQGILDDLTRRYPFIAKKPMTPIAYGVEASDFQSVKVSGQSQGAVVVRYTGAISDAMLPVVNYLLKALKKVNEQVPLQVIFTGTSYAGSGLAKPVLEAAIRNNGVEAFVTEKPDRVGYREALELSMSADMQLLVGDTTPYYAASKLMGLVASGRPFFAFVHAKSFPAKFLNELGYAYKCEFVPEDLDGNEKLAELTGILMRLVSERKQFVPISADNPVLGEYSARSMTKAFIETFEKIEYE